MGALIPLNKNAAAALTATALRIHAEKERKMLDQSIIQPAGVLEACENLIDVAAEPNPVFRNGLWFEKSGASMAVYEVYPSPYPNPLPPDYRPDRAILRVDLRDATYRTFLESIDDFLMRRYLSEVA